MSAAFELDQLRARTALEHLARLVAEGKLQLRLGRTAPLADAIALITDAERGRNPPGKAVILMG